MRKLFIFTISLVLFSGLGSKVFSQYGRDEEDELPGRFFISPDFGLVFGTLTRIEFSPSFGYHVTPRLIAGAGGRFEYYREKNYYTHQTEIQTNIYGFRLFSRLIVLKSIDDFIPINIPLSIFAHAEYESLSLEEQYFRIGSAGSGQRFWLDSVLAGGGISQRSGQRTFFNIMVLWDLTNTSSSPYINPIIKFGLQFYL